MELRSLVEKLRQAGVDEQAVTLVDVYTDSQHGTFLRSMSARYDIEIEVADMNKLVDILVIATQPKHAELCGIRWEYDGTEDTDQWIAEALAMARQRAEMIAGSLGIKIEDVHDIDYGVDGLDDLRQVPVASIDCLSMDLSVDSCMDVGMPIERTIGMGLYRTRTVGAHATVSYAIETKRPRVLVPVQAKDSTGQNKTVYREMIDLSAA
ncbi:MAG: SIMPL domain-containing protein [Pseudomonadota bacterium]